MFDLEGGQSTPLGDISGEFGATLRQLESALPNCYVPGKEHGSAAGRSGNYLLEIVVSMRPH